MEVILDYLGGLDIITENVKNTTFSGWKQKRYNTERSSEKFEAC